MNTTQTTRRATATVTLFDIGSELEDIHVQLHQVRNMLYIFNEHLESELDFIKQCNAGFVEHFLNRYDVLRSLMEVMMLNINGALGDMRVQIDAVYEADSSARPRPLATE